MLKKIYSEVRRARSSTCLNSRTGSSKNILRMTALLRNNMTSNKCAKNILVLYGPLRTWPWCVALILFGIFTVGFMYIFSRLLQIFRKPTVAIPGRNGGLFTWGIVRIFIPGQVSTRPNDRVESCPGMSFILGSSCKHLYEPS